MFENLGYFFKKMVRQENKELGSKDDAKERLHLVLMQDRANVSADFLELMKQEIIEVIKKYIVVDEASIDVRLTNKSNEDGTTGAPALYANIPIINIKNDMKAEKVYEISEMQKNRLEKENIENVNEEKKDEVKAESVEEVNEDNKPKEVTQVEVKTEEIKQEEVKIEEAQPEEIKTEEVKTDDNKEVACEVEEKAEEVKEEVKEENKNTKNNSSKKNGKRGNKNNEKNPSKEEKVDEEDEDDDVTFDELLKAAEEDMKKSEGNN